MHRLRRAFTGLRPEILLTTAVVCLLMLSLAACGRKKEEPAPEAPVGEVVESAPDLDLESAIEAVPEPTRIPRERTEYPPSTAAVLALRPDTAVVSLAMPPMQGVIDRGVAYASRVLPPETGVKAEMDRWVELFAQDLDIEDAETLSDIAAGIGLDPSRPMGAFLGGDRILEAIANLEAQAAGLAELEVTTTDEAEGDASELEADGEIDLDAADAIDFESAMETPDFALLLPCSDCPKVVETFLGLASDLPDFDADGAIEVAVGDITILQFGDTVSYFVTVEWFAVGTALELLTGIAHRFDEPATTKYGTPACPAYSDEEIVALLRADQLAGIMEAGASVSQLLGANMGSTVLSQFENSIDTYRESDDPIVVTLRLDEDEFEFLTRVDASERPSFYELSGEPGPLSLTATLPEGTPVFIGWRVTDEQKAQILEQFTEGGMPMPGEARETIERFVGLMGDEIAIATTGTGLLPIAPKVALMFRVTDTDALEDMLSELKAGTGAVFSATEFNGVSINTLQPNQVPILTLSYAIIDDAIMFSVMAPDSTELMSLVDGAMDGVPSGLFTSLDPPLDPSTPMYNVMVLNPVFVRDMLRTGAMFDPRVREASEPVGRVLDTMSELRILSGVQGDWLFQQVTMRIVPAPADLPLQPGTGTK